MVIAILKCIIMTLHSGDTFSLFLSIFYISQRLTLWYFVFLYLIFLSQQVLYFLPSTLVLTLYIDVVLSLSITMIIYQERRKCVRVRCVLFHSIYRKALYVIICQDRAAWVFFNGKGYSIEFFGVCNQQCLLWLKWGPFLLDKVYIIY